MRAISRAITCIEDLRQLAHRKVPRAFIDYAESGSYTEQTLHANRADLERIAFRQRILHDVADRSTKTTILGEPAALPWRWRRSGCAECSMAMAKFSPAGPPKPPAFRLRFQPCRSARSKTSPARSNNRSGFSSMS